MASQASQPPEVNGLPEATASRLFTTAQALSRMPCELATSIEVVGLVGRASLIAAAAARTAENFGLVAVVCEGEAVCVRFERR